MKSARSVRPMRHEAGSAGVDGQVSASQDCRRGVSAPANHPEDAESRSYYWEAVHDSKDADGVSWWQSLPDHLVESGDRDLTAIDLSATALTTVRGRIGDAVKHVVLDVADVHDFHPGRRFGLWHDRPCFHFLTALDDYRASLERDCNRPATS